MLDTITRRRLLIGAAIEKACEMLPDGYTISIELERNSGTVTLLTPSFEDDGDIIDDWGDSGFGDAINSAVAYAVAHGGKNGYL